MSGTSEFIVVGVDDSDAATQAARWAADEASRRHCELRLVHGFTLPAVAGYPEFSADSDDLPEVMRRDGEAMLDQVATDLRRRHPGLTVTTRLVYERTSVVLRSESAGAVLTVVGSGGESRLSGALLGSVTLAAASTGPAPVAIVHIGDRERTSGPVVVGIDGTATSDDAVGFAFHEASIRRAELLAVHVWNDLVVPGSHRLQNPLLDPERIRQQEREVLAERIAGWADKYPDVAVRQILVEGRAVPSLLEYAQQAQLLVVGSHGRGGFAGMLLGSTSHALIVHSAVPVVVVRSDAAH
ncbi:universal stress protein [Nakamurella sp.]|uniref:universal stress protein n=1 Tax=Nakamurella sp. TaxID=1869182 RepID=UPI003784248A